jgi:predicted SnoaL-like aldol condensation-catalyzing enzyme
MTGAPVLENNKAFVVAFYEKALNQRDPAAVAEYTGSYYKQHSPLVAEGGGGLHQYQNWIRTNFPHSHNQILRVFADGDFVVLHVHRKRSPEARGDAIVDIFRLEGGKIVEHWDVIQPVPESTASGNPMF